MQVPYQDASVAEHILVIGRTFGIGFMLVFLFFVLIGIMEIKQYGSPPRGSLRPSNLKWDGTRISLGRSVLMIFLFPLALISAFLVLRFGAAELAMIDLGGLTILLLAFLSAIIAVAFNQAFMLFGLLGYLVAALILGETQGYTKLKPQNNDASKDVRGPDHWMQMNG